MIGSPRWVEDGTGLFTDAGVAGKAFDVGGDLPGGDLDYGDGASGDVGQTQTWLEKSWDYRRLSEFEQAR